MNQLVLIDNSGLQSSLWYLVNPTTGAANCVVTVTSASDVAGIASSWSNVDQSTPFSNSASNSGSSFFTDVTVNSTPTDVVVDSFTHRQVAVDHNVGSGQTLLAQDRTGTITGINAGSSYMDGDTPDVTMQWTQGSVSDDWVATAGSMQQFVAPPVVVTKKQTHQMIL